MIKFGNDIIKVNGGWIDYTQPVPPVPTAYTVNLHQTSGGLIYSSSPSGYTGDLIQLSYSEDQDYRFDGYTVVGAEFDPAQESFYIGNSNVDVTGTFTYNPYIIELAEIWCEIENLGSYQSYQLNANLLEINGISYQPTYVEWLSNIEYEEWTDDSSNAYKFVDEYSSYSPPNYTTRVRFKLPLDLTNNSVISFGPFSPYYAPNCNCRTWLWATDTNGGFYICSGEVYYNQQTYYNNNKQRVKLMYVSPV